ncbi:hypothetical protein N7522_005153 [Penicillium canescens]|nr:hypothetical protein N7522_005153 [Penicillium canescens]
MPKPKPKTFQIARQPQQAPMITPSPQGHPMGSAWTLDTKKETVREIPARQPSEARQRIQIGGEPYAWKPKRGLFQRRPPHGPRASILPPRQPMPSIAETSAIQPVPPQQPIQPLLEKAQEMAQQIAKKKAFEMKLREINENLSRMSADTENARNASESIEPATESSSAALDTTPTPAPRRQSPKHPRGLPIPRAHGEYKYPFEYESPIRQRTIIESVEPASRYAPLWHHVHRLDVLRGQDGA